MDKKQAVSWLNYSDLEGEIIGLLDLNRNMVLATSVDGRVTARMESSIHDGLTIYFQGALGSTKELQLRINPKAALCANNTQIEVDAIFCGHPLDPNNEYFAKEYQKVHPGSFEIYSHLAVEVVFKCLPRLVTLWKYDEAHKPFRDFLDLTGRMAWREYYHLE